MQFRNRRKFQHHYARINENTTSLTDLCEGEKAVITKAMGGFGVVRRLSEMGLTPGVEIKILRKCPFHGPVQLEVRGSMLALGYGVATKVLVRPLKAEANG